jgi:beta-phosphoglucomutase-like phosphatase (HAD superfamily)
VSTGATALSRLRAVIFDVDGVLVDTEPVWRRAETDVFASVGLHLSEADCRETMGVRIGDVVRLWHERRPWAGPGVAEITDRIVAAVTEHVRTTDVARDGAVAAVRLAKECGLRCALASSSPLSLIDAVVDRLGLADAVDAVCSAENEDHGKPAPDVYLRAASLVGVEPGDCLAIEDSVIGVLAARAAGMPCIVIPDSITAEDPRLAAATLRLDSLRELDRSRLESLTAAYFA